jgi:formiminotetrahydrofolate cyclodeaminase
MLSDLGTAVALSKAAVAGALDNVEINLKSLDTEASHTFVRDVRLRVEKLSAK